MLVYSIEIHATLQKVMDVFGVPVQILELDWFKLKESIRIVFRAGGTWLITDMRRGETIFELNPQIQDQVDQGRDP